MKRECVIELLHEVPGTHGVHDKPTIERRKRYAVRTSASRSEFYLAGTIGLAPSCVFALAVAEEYDGEQQLVYHGETYRVIRAYENKAGGVELTVQRSDAE